jgi:hypothetical protein
MLSVVYKGVALPLMWTLLHRAGNSDTQERIDLINRYIRLFGKENIKHLLADREFVGGEWFAYLIPLANIKWSKKYIVNIYRNIYFLQF